MKRVLIPIAAGFEEIEAITLVDVLRRAEVSVTLAGLSERKVKGSHGILVETDDMVLNVKADDFDMILLPGGLPNAKILANDENIKSLLKEFDKNAKLIGAICAAPFALSEAGVLKDFYTCYPSFEEHIACKGYVSDKDVVMDKNILTSKGPATALRFALEIVNVLCGEKTYEKLKKELLLS